MTNSNATDLLSNAIVVVCPGRVGDLITAEPILRHAHEDEPLRDMVLFTLRDYTEVMRHCPYISRIEACASKAELLQKTSALPSDVRVIKINCETVDVPKRSFLKLEQSANLLNQFQLENNLPICNDTARFYLSDLAETPPDDLPQDYVVFHCCSGGKSRQWPLDNWRRLAEFCMASSMPVVEIGFGSVLNLSSQNYHPRCGNLRLDETGRIIRHAKALIGVESGMLHLANALDTFGFVITGSLHDMPEYNYYCGRYYEQENCNFLRFFNRSPFELPYSVVETVLSRFLAGKPMSFAECEAFCLKCQLARQEFSFLGRLWRKLREPFLKMKLTSQFHNRPRRKR